MPKVSKREKKTSTIGPVALSVLQECEWKQTDHTRIPRVLPPSTAQQGHQESQEQLCKPPEPWLFLPTDPTTSEDNTILQGQAQVDREQLFQLLFLRMQCVRRGQISGCAGLSTHKCLKSFDQEHMPVPCQWSYVTMVLLATREDSGSVQATGPSQGAPILLKRKSAGRMCITQFMKKHRHYGQVGTGHLDGFQAVEDGTCVLMDISGVAEVLGPMWNHSWSWKACGNRYQQEPPTLPSSLSPS
ncbi:hypothetical protein HJG60_010658 [Phyllostomus discolor]|uniref:Chromatin assembly factor 1 subunit p150 C-terminal domain-containing protein n=1 Tax=Phyllostomus discolor TaxID=89673 RepID=A0A834EF44_9CHIR|nr:hypothetical protein HJG60_010658 [Phyllostomus discolor]